MAMLAGPRRKQKVINLRAKNNAWSNDSSKFGQKMLEKMGWESGKGLGAKEDGIVDHVIARYKNDERGLGYEDKNDQWTKHEDDFNALLSNLSNGASTDENKLHSGVSLEDKSKKSKARVHYHKFTRGKDLSKYSEKDLANIFGKKSLKEKQKAEVVTLNSDMLITEQVFTECGSMNEYFKKKMSSIKSTLNNFNTLLKDDKEMDYSFQGFSNNENNEKDDPKVSNSFGFTAFSFYGNNETSDDDTVKEKVQNINNENIYDELKNDKPNKKKKKSKSKHIQQNDDQKVNSLYSNEVTEDLALEEKLDIDCIDPDLLSVKRPKKKKNKSNINDNLESKELNKNNIEEKNDQNADLDHLEINQSKKKKKKDKVITELIEKNEYTEVMNNCNVDKDNSTSGGDDESLRKKKKSKRKHNGDYSNELSVNVNGQTESVVLSKPKKKKRKKQKELSE